MTILSFIHCHVVPKAQKFRFTSIKAADAPVLHVEISALLAKDAIEPVPPANMRSTFVSPYFIVPKKSGGSRPILDLRVSISALQKLSFKMLTQKRVFECIRPLNWFAAIDLKEAWFHVSILPQHRAFLRFVFEDRACQYQLLPFGHLSHLGFRVNWGKSKLVPMQRIYFLDMEVDSVSQTGRLTQKRAQSVLNCLKTLLGRTAVPLKLIQRLLGHMSAATAIVLLGYCLRTGSMAESRGGPGNAVLTGFRLHRPAAEPSAHGQIPRSFRQGCPWSRYPVMLCYSWMPRPPAWEPSTTGTQFRGMDGSPTALAFQLPWVASSTPGPEPPQRVPSRQVRSGLYGQHSDLCVYQPAMHFTLLSYVATCPSPPPLESEASEVASCHPHPRSVQSDGWRAVSSGTSWGVETPSPGGPTDLESVRSCSGGPVCISRNRPLPLVLLPIRGKARHRYNGTQLAPGLAQICIPPVSLPAQTLCKIREDEE